MEAPTWSAWASSSCSSCGERLWASSVGGRTRCTEAGGIGPGGANRRRGGIWRTGVFGDGQRMGEAVTKDRGGGDTTMPYRVTRYRLLLVKDGTVPTTWDRQVRQSRDVAEFMAPLAAGLDREYFWCLALDGKNRAVALHVISVGSLTAALVHPREVFKPAILGNAAA